MGKKKRAPGEVKGSTTAIRFSGSGMSKHRKSGHTVNSSHFTGTKRGKRIRRKGISRKERQMKRSKHVNKYKKD